MEERNKLVTKVRKKSHIRAWASRAKWDPGVDIYQGPSFFQYYQ